MTRGHVAVIDIGKTNAKLALVDLANLTEIAVVKRPNCVLPGPPWPHFDVKGHWTFLLGALSRFQAEYGVDAIAVTTHGACAALLGADGQLAAPIVDYEHAGPDNLATEYDAIRPDFAETGSPRLSGGLNIGAQLHWQFATVPGLRERSDSIVTYPQYWGFQLTGVAATDVSSLGCHTDLWNPHEGQFSSLVARLGIEDKIAPARASADVLGPILPEIAEQTGLAPNTPVHCGIHDSNASLLPHLLRHETPFSVVSTGTWVIAMSVGGADVALDPKQDTLINVDAFGKPVRSARFMGGREHDLATKAPYKEPTDQDIATVLREGIMLLPAVVPDSGPFKGQTARWAGKKPAVGTGQRGGAVAFYLALVTARCLALIGHAGPIILEGPFAQNRCYRLMLSAATRSDVHATGGATGTSQGAAMLAMDGPPLIDMSDPKPTTAEEIQDAAADYIRTWQVGSGI